ncbi:MAG TPA: hypothetical protein VNI35_05395 [Nitrospira sp.]|nr:hypothetical protein [Nitrospira sp.]
MFGWLESTAYAAWVRESWGWPFALTLHAFGNAVIVGLFFIIFLRLLGMFRTIPYTSLNKLFPYIWVALGVQVFSGLSLWSSKPDRYLSDGMFDVKFSFVIASAVLTYYFQGLLKLEAASWDAAGKVSIRGVQLVAMTTLAWAAVLMTGRLTAYLGSLYS